MRAFEARTSAGEPRGENSKVSRCSGRQNSLTIPKSMCPAPSAW